MTDREAGRIADETIAYWRSRGFSANDAWEAVDRPRWQKPSWKTVRLYMVRWQLRYEADRTITKRAA